MIDLEAIKARVEETNKFRKASWLWPPPGEMGADAVEDRAELVDEVERLVHQATRALKDRVELVAYIKDLRRELEWAEAVSTSVGAPDWSFDLDYYESNIVRDALQNISPD